MRTNNLDVLRSDRLSSLFSEYSVAELVEYIFGEPKDNPEHFKYNSARCPMLSLMETGSTELCRIKV